MFRLWAGPLNVYCVIILGSRMRVKTRGLMGKGNRRKALDLSARGDAREPKETSVVLVQ